MKRFVNFDIPTITKVPKIPTIPTPPTTPTTTVVFEEDMSCFFFDDESPSDASDYYLPSVGMTNCKINENNELKIDQATIFLEFSINIKYHTQYLQEVQ